MNSSILNYHLNLHLSLENIQIMTFRRLSLKGSSILIDLLPKKSVLIVYKVHNKRQPQSKIIIPRRKYFSWLTLKMFKQTTINFTKIQSQKSNKANSQQSKYFRGMVGSKE